MRIIRKWIDQPSIVSIISPGRIPEEVKPIIAWDFGGDGNCANFYGVIRKMIQSEKYKKYFMDFEWPWYMPSKTEYEKLIAASGFSDYTLRSTGTDILRMRMRS